LRNHARRRFIYKISMPTCYAFLHFSMFYLHKTGTGRKGRKETRFESGFPHVRGGCSIAIVYWRDYNSYAIQRMLSYSHVLFTDFLSTRKCGGLQSKLKFILDSDSRSEANDSRRVFHHIPYEYGNRDHAIRRHSHHKERKRKRLAFAPFCPRFPAKRRFRSLLADLAHLFDSSP